MTIIQVNNFTMYHQLYIAIKIPLKVILYNLYLKKQVDNTLYPPFV